MAEQRVGINKETKTLHNSEPHKTKCKVFRIHFASDLDV